MVFQQFFKDAISFFNIKEEMQLDQLIKLSFSKRIIKYH